MKLFILLPAYNEEHSIGDLISRIKSGMESRGFRYEIIVYNDGCTDNTVSVLKAIDENIPLHIIGKEKNEGLGVAFLNLFKEVVKLSTNGEDIAIVLDADNTHNPEHVFHIVNKIKDGFDVVIASRYLVDSRIVGVSSVRQFLSYCASWIMRVFFPIQGVKDYTCGYRGYRISIIQKALNKFGDCLIEEKGFACMAEMLIKLRTLDVLAVEIPIILRYDQKTDESKMEIANTIRRTLLMIFRLKRIR